MKVEIQFGYDWLTFIGRFVDDGSHFDPRKKRRIANPFAG